MRSPTTRRLGLSVYGFLVLVCGYRSWLMISSLCSRETTGPMRTEVWRAFTPTRARPFGFLSWRRLSRNSMVTTACSLRYVHHALSALTGSESICMPLAGASRGVGKRALLGLHYQIPEEWLHHGSRHGLASAGR